MEIDKCWAITQNTCIWVLGNKNDIIKKDLLVL